MEKRKTHKQYKRIIQTLIVEIVLCGIRAADRIPYSLFAQKCDKSASIDFDYDKTEAIRASFSIFFRMVFFLLFIFCHQIRIHYFKTSKHLLCWILRTACRTVQQQPNYAIAQKHISNILNMLLLAQSLPYTLLVYAIVSIWVSRKSMPQCKTKRNFMYAIIYLVNGEWINGIRSV